MEHEGAQSLTIPIYEPLDFRAEERNISLTAPQVVPETSSSLPRHALLQNFLPGELSQTDVNQTGGIGSEEGKESLPSDSLEPDYEFKKRKRKVLNLIMSTNASIMLTAYIVT